MQLGDLERSALWAPVCSPAGKRAFAGKRQKRPGASALGPLPRGPRGSNPEAANRLKRRQDVWVTRARDSLPFREKKKEGGREWGRGSTKRRKVLRNVFWQARASAAAICAPHCAAPVFDVSLESKDIILSQTAPEPAPQSGKRRGQARPPRQAAERHVDAGAAPTPAAPGLRDGGGQGREEPPRALAGFPR